MGHSAYRMEQSRRERLQMEADDERKRMAPVVQATERLAKAQGQLFAEAKHEGKLAAIRSLRARLVNKPSPDFSTEPYTGSADAATITKMIGDAFGSWLETDERRPDAGDAKIVGDFAAINYLTCDTCASSTYSKAYDYILRKFAELDSEIDSEFDEIIGVPPVEPVRPIEAAATFGDGTPITELDSETIGSPIFRAACQSICDSSNKPMSGLESKRLYRHFAENSGNNGKRYGKLTVASIRRAARDLWTDALVGLTPEEARAKEESRIWESMSASDARRALKIPLESNRAPAVAYPRQQ